MAITDPEIQLALVLRAIQFEQEHSIKCDLSLMMEVFNEVLWQKNRPLSLSCAVDNIFSINNQELILAFMQLNDVPSLNFAYEIN